MSPAEGARLLSIGEFAAATQLTPKALRLYDEQRLLPPAFIDPANGYRYYRIGQVAAGRLIRTLRGTGLSLAQIADVVAAPGPAAEALVRQFSLEADRRYAREKRALQWALVSMRPMVRAEMPAVREQERPAMTVCAWPFAAARQTFLERFRATAVMAHDQLGRAGLWSIAAPCCSLVEPLSEEEGPLEVIVPVMPPASVPSGFTLKSWAARRCAVVSSEPASTHMPDPTGMLDALFDWFDQYGYRACEPPLLSIDDDGGTLRVEASWAFEPGPVPRGIPR